MPTKTVNTATKIVLGPCIDDVDFKTREEAIAYDAAGMEIDVILEKPDGSVTVTAVTPTTGGDYDWVHLDQGYYELELPASGGASYNNDAQGILRAVGYATGVLPFSSVAYDIVSATRGLAGTALPNAAADGAGGLPVSDAGGLDLDARLDAAISSRSSHAAADVWSAGTRTLTSFGTLVSDVWSAGTRALTDKAGFSLSAAGIQAIWDALTSALTTAGSIGKLLVDNVNATISSRSSHAAADVWSVGTRALTDKAGFGLADGTITANKFDQSTAYPLKSADTGATQVARTGADGDTLETLSDQIDGVGGGGEESRSHSGTAQGGAAGTITLAAGASADDNIYKHGICFIHTGTGAGEFQIIDSYVGSTKVATMAANWAVTPDATSQYRILPLGTIPGASAPTAAQVADAVLTELIADHKATSGSLADKINRIACKVVPKKIVHDKSTTQTKVYDTDGVTLLHTTQATTPDDDTVQLAEV